MPAVFHPLRLGYEVSDFFEFIHEVRFAPRERGAFQFALLDLALGVVHFLPFILGGNVRHRNFAKQVGRLQKLLERLLTAKERMSQRIRGTGHPALIHRHDETDSAGAALVPGLGGAGRLALNVVGDSLVQFHLVAFKIECDSLREAFCEKFFRFPSAVGLRLGEIQHDLLCAAQVARRLAALHRIVNGFHVSIRFLVKQLEEQREIDRIALVRRRREQQIVGGLFAEQFAQAIPLALVLRIPRRHAVRLVHDDQIPVVGLADARQDFLALGQIHRSDELRLLIPHVDAILNAQIGPAQDVERFLEAVGHFALPLEGEVCRADDEDALNQAAQLEFLEQQAGHDGLARPGVVGQEETATGGFEQVVVHRVQLVGQRVNPRNGQPEKRVVFLGQRNAERFDGQLDEFGLRSKLRFRAFNFDGIEFGLGQHDPAPESLRARADEVHHHEAVTGGGIADDLHGLAELGTVQDHAVREIVGRNAHVAQKKTPVRCGFAFMPIKIVQIVICCDFYAIEKPFASVSGSPGNR